MASSAFTIPSSLQDLEREPYELLPYPTDFQDDNEAARADSFQKLVDFLAQGNHSLNAFTFSEEASEEDKWLDEDRLQALYTLVRYV